MSSFNQSPKQVSEVALNLKLYHQFQGLEGTDISPGLHLSLMFVPGTEIFYYGCHFSTQTFSPIGID